MLPCRLALALLVAGLLIPRLALAQSAAGEAADNIFEIIGDLPPEEAAAFLEATAPPRYLIPASRLDPRLLMHWVITPDSLTGPDHLEAVLAGTPTFNGRRYSFEVDAETGDLVVQTNDSCVLDRFRNLVATADMAAQAANLRVEYAVVVIDTPEDLLCPEPAPVQLILADGHVVAVPHAALKPRGTTAGFRGTAAGRGIPTVNTAPSPEVMGHALTERVLYRNVQVVPEGSRAEDRVEVVVGEKTQTISFAFVPRLGTPGSFHVIAEIGYLEPDLAALAQPGEEGSVVQPAATRRDAALLQYTPFSGQTAALGLLTPIRSMNPTLVFLVTVSPG